MCLRFAQWAGCLLWLLSLGVAATPLPTSIKTLSLPAALTQAQAEAKHGIILAFTQIECALCKYMTSVVWAQPTVQQFYQQHFLTLPIELTTAEPLQNLQGLSVSPATLAQQFGIQANTLPVTVFLDLQGRVSYQFQGYTQQPEEFIWLGEFVLNAAYQDGSDFAHYRQQRHQQAKAATTETPSDGGAFFNLSFGDLPEEIEAAKAEQKQGLFLFFEMENCPFCQRMRQTVLSTPEIQALYQQHFKNFAIDILSDVELIDFDGTPTTSKHFSQQQHRVRATPVSIFFNLNGEEIYRHSGLITDPKEFSWLAEYVLSGAYETQIFNVFKQQKRAN